MMNERGSSDTGNRIVFGLIGLFLGVVIGACIVYLKYDWIYAKINKGKKPDNQHDNIVHDHIVLPHRVEDEFVYTAAHSNDTIADNHSSSKTSVHSSILDRDIKGDMTVIADLIGARIESILLDPYIISSDDIDRTLVLKMGNNAVAQNYTTTNPIEITSYDQLSADAHNIRKDFINMVINGKNPTRSLYDAYINSRIRVLINAPIQEHIVGAPFSNIGWTVTESDTSIFITSNPSSVFTLVLYPFRYICNMIKREEDYDITIKFIKGKSATDINKLQFASFTDSLYNYVKMIGDATINMINKPDTSSSDIIDLMQNIG